MPEAHDDEIEENVHVKATSVACTFAD